MSERAPITLNLDPGLALGWSIFNRADYVTGGTQHLDLDTLYESPGMRWIRFTAWLRTMVRSYEVGLISMEKIQFHKSGPAGIVYDAILTRVSQVGDEFGAEYKAFHPSAPRKLFAANGNATKATMIAAAKRQWPGVTFVDDNHVDATWLGFYVWHAVLFPAYGDRKGVTDG